MTNKEWQGIERIFHSAVELEPGRREAYLDEACRGEEGLRREVERLLNGEADARRQIETRSISVPADLTGRTLGILERPPDTDCDIMLPDAQSRLVAPFLQTPAAETYPEFSPGGNWIAYSSDLSGCPEVYVQSFPGMGGRWQASNGGGWEPLWAPDGKKLFYRRRPNQAWAVDIQAGSGFSASKPRLLFERSGYGIGDPVRHWDISKDGEKFLMVQLDPNIPPPVTGLVLVQNWFEELKRLVPASPR